MSAPANLGSVVMDGEMARRLTTAGRKADEWRDRRDDLIREAARDGATLREIAAAVGMSNPGVLRVIRRGPLETRHITPLHQGGSKDDPDNMRFVSPEENARLPRDEPEARTTVSYRTELWDRPGAPEVDHITRSGRYWWADPAAHPYRAADRDRPEDGCASCGYLAGAHSVTP